MTLPLIFVTTRATVVKQHVFAATAWHPALWRAGVDVTRVNGLHALRHSYASALLDAGESIKAVFEWLGHANAAFTLGSMRTSCSRAQVTPVRRSTHSLACRPTLTAQRRPSDGPAGELIFRCPGHHLLVLLKCM